MILPLIAMGLIMAAFFAILFWVLVVLRDSPMPRYMANLPLSDGPLVDESQEDSSNE
jgi:hypothetical protein